MRRLTAEEGEELRPYFDVPTADFRTDARHREAAAKMWSVMRPAAQPKDAAKKAPVEFEPTLPF